MSVDVIVTAPGCCMAHNHQFTYNYSPALREAGFPSWRMLNNLRAEFVMLMLNRLRAELDSNRARYESLIKGEGDWGTWETMMSSLRALQGDLERHLADGTVRTL